MGNEHICDSPKCTSNSNSDPQTSAAVGKQASFGEQVSLTPVSVGAVLRNIYPSTPRPSKASKMSRGEGGGGSFLCALPLKCHGYLPKYLCRANRSTPRQRLACVYQPATTKGDDALSHWCNLNLHSRGRHLKGAERRRGPSLEKGQLCPWAALSSPHLPVKTLVARQASRRVSLTHWCFSAHAAASVQTLRSSPAGTYGRTAECCLRFTGGFLNSKLEGNICLLAADVFLKRKKKRKGGKIKCDLTV